MKKCLFYAMLIAASLFCQQCAKDGEKSINLPLTEEVEEEPMVSDSIGCSAESEPASRSSYSPSGELPENLKLEKSANITIDSKQTALCRKCVDTLMGRFHAYVAHETYSDWRKSYDLTIRVPSASLDSFVACLSGAQGKIVEKSVSVVDRTTEYKDVSSRKKTQDAMLENYRKMLSQATKVSDMLEIQRRIDEIQIRADRAQGRLNQIDRNVDYSVLNLSIEDRSYVSPKTDDGNAIGLSDFGEAIVNGWHGVVAVVWFLFNLWPLWIVAGVVIYFVKRKKNKNK